MNIMNELTIEDEVTLEKQDLYEEKINEKSILEMMFDSIDIDGNLYFYVDDVRVQLDNLDINITQRRARYRASALDIPYLIMVSSVDRLGRVVHVSHYKVKDIIKKELTSDIQASIKRSSPITIMA